MTIHQTSLLTDLPRFERIDGVSYVWGSAEHGQAIDRQIAKTQRTILTSPHTAKIAERADANGVAFLARDLVYVSRDVQKVLYEKLRAAEFIPIKSEVPRGAQEWVYRQTDMRGEARHGAHLHTDDAPTAEVATEEFGFPVSHATAAYQYTIDELEAAAFAGIPLQRAKAEACAEMIARKLDKLMRHGDASMGLVGFLNNTNVPDVALDNGEWLTATADEIIADWAEIEQAVIAQSRDNHAATRILLPTAYEGRLATLAHASNAAVTLKEWLTTNGRSIKEIMRWMALDDATGSDVGVADPPMGVAYDPRPENVFCELPVPYEELAPEVRNFGWVVNARASFGGVVWKRPKSAVYVENLD